VLKLKIRKTKDLFYSTHFSAQKPKYNTQLYSTAHYTTYNMMNTFARSNDN